MCSMSAFFAAILVALLLAGAWGSFAAIRRFENATARLDGVGEDE